MSSLLAESLFCLECEERHPFPSEMRLYQPPGKEGTPAYRDWDWAVMLTDRVWCFQCERPAYVERVPSQREFEVAAKVRSLPDRPRLPNVEDELLEIDSAQFEFLAKHLAGRQPSGCCLACGSTSVRHLQLAIDRVVNLKHPFCGGSLRIDRVYVNGFGPKTIHWFAVNGSQIGGQNDQF